MSWEGVPANLTFLDVDEDGFIGCNDNCPHVYNPEQADSDSNGIGDVCEFIRGDINGDGVTDVLDVVVVVSHILGIHLLEGNAYWRADCNGDDRLDVLDALDLVNVILGIGMCEP